MVFKLNTGNIEFENQNHLNIKGNLNSDLKLDKIDFKKFI